MAAARLGVDFGTSNTVAVLARPDGRINPLLVDGQPQLPSSVCAVPNQPLLVGRAALHTARLHPEGFEPNPKRRIDDGVVLLGTDELSVVDLLAAVLGRVAEETRRVTGEPHPAEVRLTHPAVWGPARRDLLRQAAMAAGWPAAILRLVPEPVAAAAAFAEVHGARLPIGGNALVYDLGGGTFDATVLRRTANGYDVRATDGLADAGGLDIDHAILTHLGAAITGRNPATWAALTQPRTSSERRARWLLHADVRAAKEVLSSASSTLIPVPLIDDEVPLTRDELDGLTRPLLDRTVGSARGVLRDAGLSAGDLAAVFLVGGSTRIPLVATILHRTLGVPATVLEQPELIVAEGALRVRAFDQAPTAPAPGEFRPAPVRPAAPMPPAPVSTAPVSTAPMSTAPMSTAPVSTAPVSTAPPVSAPSGRLDLVEARGHAEAVTAVTVSPDGTRLATASADRTVRIWELSTGRQIVSLTGHTGRINAVAASPDGGLLVSVADDQTARVWDPRKGATLKTLTGHTDMVRAVAFHPDGRRLATGSFDHTVRIWDVEGGETGRLTGHTDMVRAVAFHPDGRRLATGSFDESIRIWDLATGHQLANLTGHGLVHAVVFSPDGTRLATAGVDGTARIWTAEGTRPIAERLVGHAGAITATAFSPDGRALATAGVDGTARLWDSTTGRALVPPLTGHSAGLTAVAFSPDGRRLVTASHDTTVRVWPL